MEAIASSETMASMFFVLVDLLYLGGDGCGQGLHLFGGEFDMVAEVHVVLFLKRDEVDVCVGHFQSQDGHTYLGAGAYLFHGFGHLHGESLQFAVFLFGEVEDVIYFAFGYAEYVTFLYGVDVEEGVAARVLGYLVAGYLAGYDFGKDGCHFFLRGG